MPLAALNTVGLVVSFFPAYLGLFFFFFCFLFFRAPTLHICWIRWTSLAHGAGASGHWRIPCWDSKQQIWPLFGVFCAVAMRTAVSSCRPGVFFFPLHSRECCCMHLPITYVVALYTAVGHGSAISGDDILREHMIVYAFNYTAWHGPGAGSSPEWADGNRVGTPATCAYSWQHTAVAGRLVMSDASGFPDPVQYDGCCRCMYIKPWPAGQRTTIQPPPDGCPLSSPGVLPVELVRRNYSSTSLLMSTYLSSMAREKLRYAGLSPPIFLHPPARASICSDE